MTVLQGLKGHDDTEGINWDMMALKGLKRRDGTEGVKHITANER